MSKFELKLPRMGESVAEATLTAWLKEVGETIEMDEPIFEIATDKVDSEVPSEVEGVLVEKLFAIDDVIKVGQTVAIIEIEGEAIVGGSSEVVEVSEDTVADPEAVGVYVYHSAAAPVVVPPEQIIVVPSVPFTVVTVCVPAVIGVAPAHVS